MLGDSPNLTDFIIYNLPLLLDIMPPVILLLALNDQTAFSAHIIACAVIVVRAFFRIDPFSLDFQRSSSAHPFSMALAKASLVSCS